VELKAITKKALPLLIAVLFANFGHGQEKPGDTQTKTSSISPQALRDLFKPYMKVLEHDQVMLKKSSARIELGRVLFYDRRLSPNSEVSCNDCHDLAKHGTNGDHYTGLLKQKKTKRDVPSIYNKGGLKLFNWDGSHTTLKSKTTSAITSEHEMNMANTGLLIQRLKGITGYQSLFTKAFPRDKDSLKLETLVEALVSFEKALITPAPIDRFMAGNDKALSAEQLEGGLLFDRKFCATCHTGTMFGGQMLQKLGAVRSWPNQKDLGYYYTTKVPEHKMIFRVSSLRNVEKTAPYFHDASSRHLWDAVRKIAWHELGQFVSVKEALSIQEFLKALTGEIPKGLIKKPTLPK
jgi:cytochrome c peroxidase|tara:strand:- start:12 stop:1061 length:1050 start_codon:yes stop_codon:yes gene_type:complete